MVMAGTGAKAAEVGSQAAYGFTTDKVDALKALVLPDYMKNSNVIISEAEDGSPVIANLSSWDAYDFPKKPLQIIINKYMKEDSLNEEGLVGEVLSAILTETVSPFLGESIIQEQLSNYFVRGGKTIDDKKIKNSFNKLDVYDDSFGTIGNMINNLPILMSNLLESVTPGSITRATDLYSTLTDDSDQTSFNQDKYEAQAFLKFVTGWGMSPINPEYVDTMYKYKASKFNKEKSELRNELRNAIDRKDFDLDIFTEQYLDVNTRYYKEYSKFAKLGEAFNTLGGDLYKSLKDTNVSSKDRFAFTSESYFVPLEITASMEVDILNATSGFDEYMKVKRDINAIQNKFSSLPVFHNGDNYKSQKEKVKTIKEELRENYKTGGLVPNVEENPEDRINPVTGQTYEETRLGFSGGGSIDNVLAESLFGIDAKWQRAHEKETAQLVNRKIDEGVFPSRARVPVNPTTGNVEGRIPDEEIFNTVNHQRLSYKVGDTGIKRTGLQLREALSFGNNLVKRATGETKQETFLRHVQDDKVDFLNNRIGFDLKKRNLTAEDAENEIINNTIKRFNLKGK